MPDHTIIVRASSDGAYSVTVEPPHPNWGPRVFGDVRSARGFAGGIKIATGWPRRDEAGGA